MNGGELVVRDLPEAITQMVEHAHDNFEPIQRLGKVSPEWEADYHSIM